jgi:maltose phosphorylase
LKKFDAESVKSSESLSIGNGAMGQRANFEESYSGDTFSYIAGIYYPDKKRDGGKMAILSILPKF